MALVEDTIDLDFAEDELLGDELSSVQQMEHTETSISVEPSKVHGEHQEQWSRRNRCKHARVRYHSSPTSESDDHSRSTSVQRDVQLNDSFSSDLNSQKREKRLAHARRFGIIPPSQSVDIKESEVEELYRSMGVQMRNSRHRLHSVYVRGVDGLSTYQIEKMFAEFDPVAVEMIDEVSCNVIWNDRFSVAKMMLEMTKPLKRIRSSRQVEEGEVADSGEEEEDGEMREEQGDDVTISVAKGLSSNKRNTETNAIEVEVDQVEVPPGKWRVITKHVGHKRLIILRFSLREDIAKGRRNSADRRRRISSDSVDPDGYTYKWMNRRNRVRPGLNIFDEKGNELEWDYEHDTRFYEEPAKTAEEEDSSSTPTDDKMIVVGTRKHKIKTRGRGAKRFKSVADSLSGTGSLEADREDLHPLKRNFANANDGAVIRDEEESDLSDDRDPSPTPQPWDLKKTNVHLRQK
ncbi:conserved hypothetical protein [Brugia malayi]|uniref:Nuclear cap-binding protein subunit 3 n=1 Tax=Brugia malayi TaxID=6279 RepID=A0A4E9FU19_BRUMA|nr:uncharacterized protein BM_BM3258 [Brugia malayi]VIO97930.1 conserved hypothetical protein [Brugia malayi]